MSHAHRRLLRSVNKGRRSPFRITIDCNIQPFIRACQQAARTVRRFQRAIDRVTKARGG